MNIYFKQHYFDLENSVITNPDGEKIDLIPSEAKFLECIFTQPGVATYEILRKTMWKDTYHEKNDRSVNEIKSNLIAKAPVLDSVIKVVKSTGYSSSIKFDSRYARLFSVIDEILNTASPNYAMNAQNKLKACTLTRTSFISLCKLLIDEDLNCILSIDLSADKLNRIATKQTDVHPIIKEMHSRGLRFFEKNDIIHIAYEHEIELNIKTNTTPNLTTLTALFESYKAFEYHNENDFYVKKKEINITISEYLRALAFSKSFIFSENKSLYIDIVTYLIKTHNHDNNYIYPLLHNSYTNSVDVTTELEKVTELICDYYNDVYNTDLSSIYFSNNFIKLLNKEQIDTKIGILRKLIFENNCFDITIWKSLVYSSVNNYELFSLKKYIEKEIFTILNSNTSKISEKNARKLTAFICMFARGSFPAICFDNDNPNYLKNFFKTIRLIITKSEQLFNIFPLRCGDIAQGLATCIMTTFKLSDADTIKQLFEGINFESSPLNNYKLLKSTYELLVLDITPSVESFDFSNLFFDSQEKSDERFIDYIKETFIPISNENIFTTTDQNALNLALYLHFRKIISRKHMSIDDDLKIYSDTCLFYLIEAAKEKPSQKMFLAINHYNYCLIKENHDKKNKMLSDLYESALRTCSFDDIPYALLGKFWTPGFNKICQTDDADLLQLLDKYINHFTSSSDGYRVADFLLKASQYCTDESWKKIKDFLTKCLTNNLENLSYHVIKKALIDNFENQDLMKEVFCKLHTTNLSDGDKFRLFDIISKELYNTKEVIDSLITNGNKSRYYDLVMSFLTKTYFRSWEKVYLFPLCSKLLNFDVFTQINTELRCQLLHFCKKNTEYNEHFALLLEEISKNTTFFSPLSVIEKTALSLYSNKYIDIFDEKNQLFFDFLQDILGTLTNNELTNKEIQNFYGLKTETLTYHIVEVFKEYPEKTAPVCLLRICKLYKQLLKVDSVLPYQTYIDKMLQERIRAFETYASNPCIRNTVYFICEKSIQFINSHPDAQKLKTIYDKFYRICNNIVRDKNYPSWFHCEQIAILKEDTFIENHKTDIDSLEIGNIPSFETFDYEKFDTELNKWRTEDFEKPFEPSLPLVIYTDGKKVKILSGWTTVLACKRDDGDIYPKKILSFNVTFGEADVYIPPDNTASYFDADRLYENFHYLYNLLDKNLPRDCTRRSATSFEIIFGKSFKEAKKIDNPKLLIEKLNTFLRFYYMYVENNNLEVDSPKAYIDYYNSVEKNISKILNTFNLIQ